MATKNNLKDREMKKIVIKGISFKKRSQRDLSKPFVKNSHMIALGLGDLGYSLISCTAATYIASFAELALNARATLMGIAIAIGVIIDAISDPIVGYWSDNFKNKIFGKRHLFILIGLIGMMLTSVFIWNIPYEIIWAKYGKDSNTTQIIFFIWFAVGLTVLRTFNTLYYTPIGAFSVEVSTDYNERTTIQAVRSVFYIIGMLLPVIIMGSFQNKHAYVNELGQLVKGQFVAQGYIDFSWVALGICVVTSAFLMIMTFPDIKIVQARQSEEKAKERPTLKMVLKDFFGVLKDGNMRSIIFGYAISMISATLIIALGFHVFSFTFEMATTQMYILMGSLLGMTILGQPLWPLLAKKLDKRKSMLMGLSISLVGCILLFICWALRSPINNLIAQSSWGIVALMPALMLSGLGTGVLYSMPLALIGDVVVKKKHDGGGEQTGTYAGMMTFAYKVSQSLTQLVANSLLVTIGFVSGQHFQSDYTSSKLGLILCIGVTVAVFAGIIIYSRLKIDKKEITEYMANDNNGLSLDSSLSGALATETLASEDQTEEEA